MLLVIHEKRERKREAARRERERERESKQVLSTFDVGGLPFLPIRMPFFKTFLTSLSLIPPFSSPSNNSLLTLAGRQTRVLCSTSSTRVWSR